MNSDAEKLRQICETVGGNRANVAQLVRKLKTDYAKASARVVELTMLMPCGHAARYFVEKRDAMPFCALCELQAVTMTEEEGEQE